jgi:hypothetical protein
MLPPEFAPLIVPFRSLFSKRIFARATTLLIGAVLAVRFRTVAAALRAVGLAEETNFSSYHRVLSRAHWSAREGARRLLRQLVERFAPEGPVVIGIDDTIERRWGPNIKARGIYRDPTRSSKGHFVKASGLRWLSVQLLAEVPWASRVWALPFLTMLCPSERYRTERGLRHKKLTDWARQALLQVARWLSGRQVVAVADRSFAAIELLATVSAHVTMITRLRLDAALYDPAPERRPGQVGRPRKKGPRQPSLTDRLSGPNVRWTAAEVSPWYGRSACTLEIATGTAVWWHPGMPVVPLRWVLVKDPTETLDPKAFLCTDLQVDPIDVLRWFVRRWTVEVTFEEVRRHLGVETQRQWSDLAILRTTPCLLGLFSIVTLMADRLASDGTLPVRQAAWYRKQHPTFSDALAGVRMLLWQHGDFLRSGSETETMTIPKPFYHRLLSAIAYAT